MTVSRWIDRLKNISALTVCQKKQGDDGKYRQLA